MITVHRISTNIASGIKRRLKERLKKHPLYEIWDSLTLNRFLFEESGRETAWLRKPKKFPISYKFSTKPSDEEHRTYKLLDGKYEEYTRIEAGLKLACGKVSMSLAIQF